MRAGAFKAFLLWDWILPPAMVITQNTFGTPLLETTLAFIALFPPISSVVAFFFFTFSIVFFYALIYPRHQAGAE